MIVKRYTHRQRKHPLRVGDFWQDCVGWYLFGFIPLYIADV